MMDAKARQDCIKEIDLLKVCAQGNPYTGVTYHTTLQSGGN